MENDKITMTDEEIIKDYPRLKLEYARLHEDFRRLQSKQLNLAYVTQQREQFDNFYAWLDGLTQEEYDDMSLTEKCEKFFFKN